MNERSSTQVMFYPFPHFNSFFFFNLSENDKIFMWHWQNIHSTMHWESDKMLIHSTVWWESLHYSYDEFLCYGENVTDLFSS